MKNNILKFLIYNLLHIYISSFNIATTKLTPRNFLLRLTQSNDLIIEQIKNPISKYMSLRKQDNLDDLSDKNSTVIIRSYVDILEKRKKKDSFFDMVKPSGWFKDKYEIDLNSRIDKSKPRIAHPLSYNELKKYGYEYLIDQIYELGGPHACGKLLNIDWVDPVDKEIWDESLRPQRQETFTLDMKGELSLGLSLEDKLSVASDIDIENLKSEIEKHKNNTMLYLDNTYSNSDGIIYPTNSIKKKVKYIAQDIQKSDKNELFKLTDKEKIYSVLLTLSISIAYGRATSYVTIIDSDNLRDIATYLSLSLAIVSIISGIFSISNAKSKNRNELLWFLLGFCGGPMVIDRLKQLNSIDHENKN